MKYEVRKHQFNIELTSKVKTSSYFKNKIRHVVKKTLLNIPEKLLNKLLIQSKPYLLTISLVSPEQIKKINRQFRGKNKTTDVLSFSRLEAKTAVPYPEIGDLIICPVIAVNEAPEWSSSPREQVMRITIHGILHLFGYDHEINSKEEKRMFKLQEKILKSLL